jgi:D-3-phosphoglycerate dehydrogenase
VASAPQNIPVRQGSTTEVSSSFSTSPTLTFHSTSPYDRRTRSGTYGVSGILAKARQLKPFATEDIKILLLENVNVTGREALEEQGYQVEAHKASLPEEELIQKIRYYEGPLTTASLLYSTCPC